MVRRIVYTSPAFEDCSCAFYEKTYHKSTRLSLGFARKQIYYRSAHLTMNRNLFNVEYYFFAQVPPVKDDHQSYCIAKKARAASGLYLSFRANKWRRRILEL